MEIQEIMASQSLVCRLPLSLQFRQNSQIMRMSESWQQVKKTHMDWRGEGGTMGMLIAQNSKVDTS